MHDCEQYEEDGFMFFQCNIKTDMSTLETWGSAMMDLRNRLVDFQTQTDKIVDLLSLRNAATNQSVLNGDLISSQPSASFSGSSVIPSTSSGSSVSFQPQNTNHGNANNALDSARPLTVAELNRCPTLTVPKPEQMPTIVLLPETSGLKYG